jgi:bacterioferritin-associated ferredoxin
MKSFRTLIETAAHFNTAIHPTVSLNLSPHTLHLKFDSLDLLTAASYSGKFDPWYSSLCEVAPGKTLSQLLNFSISEMDIFYQSDATYWELKQDIEGAVFHPFLELLRATLDLYRGRDYQYQDVSPLICRCFGVREKDVENFLSPEKEPTLEKLATATRASQGCRTCLPQLERMLLIEKAQGREKVFKNKTIAQWILEIDYMLSCFPSAIEWEMQVESVKQRQVIISYKKLVPQREEESMGIELQGFLSAGVDEDFSFFLRRS